MNDYMRALHQRFFREPDVAELEEDIENTRQEVRDYLDNKNKPTPPKRPPRHTKAADSVEKKRDLEVQEDGDNRDGPVRERQ